MKKLIFIAIVLIFGIIATMFSINKINAPSSTDIRSVAAMGDSISEGFNTCETLADCPVNSWSTGASPDVESHATRLQDLIPAGQVITSYNNSVSGSKSSDLSRQATITAQQKPGYVTILSGSNDLCAPTTDSMTSTANFTSNLRASLTILSTSSPDTKVLVASLPNLKNLYDAGKGNIRAQQTWKIAGICQSLLANVGSESSEDNQRRETVYSREKEYNDAIKTVCAEFANCFDDNNAVYDTTFSADDLTKIDFFHPSVEGQNKLSEITWEAVKNSVTN